MRASHPNHLDYLGSRHTNQHTQYTTQHTQHTQHTNPHRTTHTQHTQHNTYEPHKNKQNNTHNYTTTKHTNHKAPKSHTALHTNHTLITLAHTLVYYPHTSHQTSATHSKPHTTDCAPHLDTTRHDALHFIVDNPQHGWTRPLAFRSDLDPLDLLPPTSLLHGFPLQATLSCDARAHFVAAHPVPSASVCSQPNQPRIGNRQIGRWWKECAIYLRGDVSPYPHLCLAHRAAAAAAAGQ